MWCLRYLYNRDCNPPYSEASDPPPMSRTTSVKHKAASLGLCGNALRLRSLRIRALFRSSESEVIRWELHFL